MAANAHGYLFGAGHEGGLLLGVERAHMRCQRHGHSSNAQRVHLKMRISLGMKMPQIGAIHGDGPAQLQMR